MWVSGSIFFTARFAQGAKFAEEKYIFFSAKRAENKICLRKNHSMAIQSIYTDQATPFRGGY